MSPRMIHARTAGRAARAPVLVAAAILGSGAASAGDALPAPLASAFAEAEAASGLVVSYTMTFRWAGQAPVVARFEAGTGLWTVLSGDPDKLPRIARGKFANWKRSESVAGGLTYADYAHHLEDVTLVSEDADAIVYRFAAAGARDGDAETRLVLDPQGGGLARYRVAARAPIRPDPATRLDTFVFEQTFARVLEGAPPLMTHVRWRAEGSRAFRRVDENYEIDFSDFARP